MKTIILILLISTSAISQGEEFTKLFPGKWKMNTDNSEYYEEWKQTNESELTGIGYSIEAGDTIISEKLYLKKFAHQWAYVAIPENQAIALFALKEFSQNKFIFENEEHNYPQRIIYEFVSDTQLNARIEGMIEGELMSRDFTFIRTEK